VSLMLRQPSRQGELEEEIEGSLSRIRRRRSAAARARVCPSRTLGPLYARKPAF
jgi:hypothetical protein